MGVRYAYSSIPRLGSVLLRTIREEPFSWVYSRKTGVGRTLGLNHSSLTDNRFCTRTFVLLAHLISGCTEHWTDESLAHVTHVVGHCESPVGVALVHLCQVAADGR